MNITPDIKLDFDDVLIRPKRTDTVSRSEVDLTREYTFRNSRVEYTGVPIIASNRSAQRPGGFKWKFPWDYSAS